MEESERTKIVRAKERLAKEAAQSGVDYAFPIDFS